jgi:oxygen-independent coproporphyrinogen-3 oxidase
MAGLYIHVPFCKQACSYCDFYFVTRTKLIPDFVDRLVAEIRSHADFKWSDETFTTLYLGGGTPSLLKASDLQRIVAALEETFTLRLEEFTVEMNPDDVTADYLEQLADAGVNRLSMGIQSFDPQLLQFMHRAHTSEEAERSLKLLSESPIPTFTVDLIYGNPGQTVEQLQNDLDRLLAYDPPHVSAYSLTIEPRTRLGKMREKGKLQPPPDDKVATHAERVREALAGAGIQQYEISNYAKPGSEAVHNTHYWRHIPYLGLGPSAHSFWPEIQDDVYLQAQRWSTVRHIKPYLDSEGEAPVEETENLSQEELAEERIMLALRTKWGISEQELQQHYRFSWSDPQRQWIKQQLAHGMIASQDPLVLSERGRLLADSLTVDLLSV